MSDPHDPELPQRYEPVRRLGRGGGGEVWAVRDRATGRTYALKLLAEEASEREMAALVREAVALSGLEGLGVPRVIRFGRLADSGRAYLVREVVEGDSLETLLSRRGNARAALESLARAADQLVVGGRDPVLAHGRMIAPRDAGRAGERRAHDPFDPRSNRNVRDPARALFAEDMARNLAPAKALGMTTLWIDNGSEQAGDGARDHIDYVTGDLGDWLTGILGDDE